MNTILKNLVTFFSPQYPILYVILLLFPTQYRLNFRFNNLETNILIINFLNESYIEDNENGFSFEEYVTN